jgi:hypothetical protein
MRPPKKPENHSISITKKIGPFPTHKSARKGMPLSARLCDYPF